jgi:NAD(P)-dependent dehydrogenase (short-subunit alcohol dehydrogenase family)
MGRFDGRVVVVTGAASGLGEATSARLLSEGATVIGADINEPSSSPPASGGKWFPAQLDVRDEDAVAAVIASADRVDGVFTAAGVGSAPSTSTSPAPSWCSSTPSGACSAKSPSAANGARS